MKKYLIRWNGMITRDCGTIQLEANDLEEARRTFYARYKMRKIQYVHEFAEPPKVTVTPGHGL